MDMDKVKDEVVYRIKKENKILILVEVMDSDLIQINIFQLLVMI